MVVHIRLVSLRHNVVNILDKNHIVVECSEIVEQRSVSARTEYQSPMNVSQRFSVSIKCQGIGMGRLHRKTDFQGTVQPGCEVNECLAIVG